MALFNFFKKPKTKKETAPPKEIKQKLGKEKGLSQLKRSGRRAEQDTGRYPAEQTPSAKEADKAKGASGSVKLKESKIGWQILAEPHVTEKSTGLTDLNQYTFKMFSGATKLEVKRAISEIYGVHVEKVRKIKVARKQRNRALRRRRQMGWRSGYTKAIVTLRKGEKIEVLPH